MNWTDEDKHWMKRAIALAKAAEGQEGKNPIGCVIVLDGKVIGEGTNEVGLHHDPSAHAEIVSMRRAGSNLGQEEFRGAVLYSTLQPCGMCTMASIWAKVGRIVFGAGKADVHSMYFEDRHLDTTDFIKDAFRNDLSFTGGLMADECAALYVPPNANVPKEEQVNL